MLEFKGIDKYYNPGTVNEMCLFENFNLKINDGEFVSVVGRTDREKPPCSISSVEAFLRTPDRSS